MSADRGVLCSERPHYGLLTCGVGRIETTQIGCLRQHVISLDLVKDCLLLSEHLKHDRHEEHEGQTAALPQELEGEVFDNLEDFVEEVDSLEAHVCVVLNQLLILSQAHTLRLLSFATFLCPREEEKTKLLDASFCGLATNCTLAS